LCEFSPSDKWSLLYRTTRDGFGSHDFHSKCDGHSNTLTLLKAKESEFYLGGIITVSWELPANYKSDPNAFISSLTNKDNKPIKMKVDPNRHESAIGCQSELGPTFGFVGDIYKNNNANTTLKCYSYLGHTYHIFGSYISSICTWNGINEAQLFLAGSFNFQLDEIEVYEKEQRNKKKLK
jgi:hypothetical protein